MSGTRFVDGSLSDLVYTNAYRCKLQLDEDLHTLICGEISRKLFNYETFGSELGLEFMDLGVQQYAASLSPHPP